VLGNGPLGIFAIGQFRTLIFATMAATETNTDIFLGAINVFSGASPSGQGSGAQVSVVEVPVPGNDPVSIRES